MTASSWLTSLLASGAESGLRHGSLSYGKAAAKSERAQGGGEIRDLGRATRVDGEDGGAGDDGHVRVPSLAGGKDHVTV
jgi:hypothetical protein